MCAAGHGLRVDGVCYTANAAATHVLQVGVLFGSPETTSGGMALKYYSSMRLDIRAKEKLMEAGKAEPVGNKVKVKVVKNKVRMAGLLAWQLCTLHLR